MKREYFGMLFMIAFVGLYFLLESFIGEEAISHYLSRFIVVWLLIAFSIGQYSMKFPKAF
jgi:hypothetical protein